MTLPDRRIERIARRQFGAFTIDQATEAGLTQRMMGVRVRSGAWTRRARGIFVINAVPVTWEQHLMSAVLNHDGSQVCGPAALVVHQMHGARRCRPELVVPSTGAHRSSLAVLHRSDDVEGTMVGPIPVVTPTQALFDIAGTIPLRSLRRTAEDAILRGLIDPGHLRARFEQLEPSCNRGIGDMRAVVGVVCGRGYMPPSTELEALLSDLFEELGVHLDRQKRLSWRAPVAMIVDAVSDDLLLIAEADGRTWHGRIEALSTDRKRDLAALAHGYETVRCTYEMLTVERSETRAELEQYLALRRSAVSTLRSRRFQLPA